MKFNRAINYFCVLLWMGYCITTGVHLFSKGFLLTRISQTNFTECTPYKPFQCDDNETCDADDPVKSVLQNLNNVSYCFPRKAKIVFLLIDALRYDFGVYDPTLKEPLPFQNKLPIMHELLVRQEERTRLVKFIADPPTTTLQRLKGMTTGSLPTFIDVGSNFASPEINEDNWVDQIVRSNKTAVFLGDNTWTELFPTRFIREYAYPSFDIYDLDKIDTAIQKHLPQELKRTDWDVLIAHFLGVDHCGHKHGPLHSEMGRKLSEMDKIIRDVIEQIDDDTVLVVAGDHGMTMTGDHGGETREEVSALLFMYSKSRPFVPNYLEFDQNYLHQIDIVPVISTILGIPLPYSNLGVLNFNLIPDAPLEGIPRHQWLLMHLWQNAIQVQEYFLQYAANTNVFNAKDIEALKHKFLTFSYRVHSIKTETGFINFAKDLKRYLHEICQICRDLWIKFDPNLISQGLVITVTATILIFIIMNYLPITLFDATFTSELVTFIYVSNGIVASLGYLFRSSIATVTVEHAIILSTNVFSLGILAYIILQNWPHIAQNMSKSKKFSNIPLRFIFIFSCATFFSNSWLVQEQKVLLYLVTSLIVFMISQLKLSVKVKLTLKTKMWSIFRSLTLIGTTVFAMLSILIIQLTRFYFKCREEQGNCIEQLIQHAQDQVSSKTKNNFDLLPLVCVALMAAGMRLYLKSCGNLSGFSFNISVIRYGTMLAAVCTGAHFALTKSGVSHNVPQVHIDALAWIVFAIFIIQTAVLLANPLLLYILPPRTDEVSFSQSNVVPEIYRQIKKSYDGAASRRKIPIVSGLATVYSATLISFGTILAITFALLLGSNAAIGLFLLITTSLISIAINAVIRYETSSTLVTCIQPNFCMLLFWFLSSHFGFYATGHQATLSQIDWNAAFVGRSAFHDHSVFLSGFLVVLNTFSSSLWYGLLYPLMIISPFLYYAITQTWNSKETEGFRTITVNKTEDYLPIKDIDFDISRGEVNLYENEKRLVSSAFKSASLLFVLQGVRVFCSMMACTVHCRHLMVWKIFAPRFIYEGITTYILFIAISLGFLLLFRIQKAVNYFIDTINKSD